MHSTPTLRRSSISISPVVRARRVGLVLAFGLTIAAPATQARLPDAPAPLYHADEVLVQYRSAAAATAAKSFQSRQGMQRVRTLADGHTQLLRLPSFTRVEAALPVLRADPDVVLAEPNYIRKTLAYLPNDPLFDLQWALHATGQENFVPDSEEFRTVVDADMDLPEAWDADNDGIPDRTGDGSVTLAVIDTGFQLDHPDLAANFIAGFDFAEKDTDPSPDDAALHNHGTLVAGAAGAVGDNGEGIAGVIWNVKLMPLKVARIRNGASELTVDAILDAYDYARTHGADIVNASFGGPSFSQMEFNAIKALTDAGVLFVTSAGNFNANLDDSVASYPANYDIDRIVTVGATNRQDNLASFSQYGPTRVDVAAPGLQIVLTDNGSTYTTPQNCGAEDGSGSCGSFGTSFAAPHAAGVAALAQTYHPGIGALETKARLIEGGDPGAQGGDSGRLSAGGRVNANDSLNLAARPAIVIKNVRLVDADGNQRLDPSETLDIELTLHNLWQPATAVLATLSAPADAVTVQSLPQSVASLGTDDTAIVRFTVQVKPAVSDYRQIDFTLNLSANGGSYVAQRHFLREIAELKAGSTAQANLSTDLHDDFHTYHFDFDDTSGNAPGARLAFCSQAETDIDLLVKRGSAPQYDIDLAANPDDNPTFFTDADQVGGDEGGNESVIFENPAAGTYYVTVVNFALTENLPYALRVASTTLPLVDPCTTDGSDDEDDGSSGGGSLSTDTLAAFLSLALLALARRRLHRGRHQTQR